MTNFDLSLIIFSVLKQAGVQNVVVCAGARNAPLVLALQEQNFKIFNYFEERSAAFFALGLIKSTKRPVAVLTTSGTAAAELLPAAIEATYQGLPLILVTADRPKRYRGTGSPQTIEQVGLFSNYVESVYDLDANAEKFDFKWSLKKPLHLNVSFEEPLVDKQSDSCVRVNLKITSADVKNSKLVNNIQNPLIIVSEFDPKYKNKIIEFIINTKAPVYAEPLSQIKNLSEVELFLIHSTDLVVQHIFQNKLCDSVIRIGNVPTLRFWRDLEDKFKDVPVVNYTDLPYSGLSRESGLYDVSQLQSHCEYPFAKMMQIKQFDSKLEIIKDTLLQKYPLSEQSLTNKLSDVIKTEPLYLGNSLPIRNWDQFAKCYSLNISANRGANGIDGQIATYLGWSENYTKSYCYVGDLTALYDLAALGLMPQLNDENQHNIIVVNNFGGQIFMRVFKDYIFTNAHTIQFQHWAQMWNWNYLQVSHIEDLQKVDSLKTKFNIIEVLPKAEQTWAFWREWDEQCQQI